jgi:glycogen operon protein
MDTASWNEGPDTVALPGRETLIGGAGMAYGAEGRSVVVLVAR